MEEKEVLAQESPEQTIQIKPSGRKKMLPIVLAGCLLLAVVLLCLVRANQFTLSIRLEGEEDLLLEYGETYHDPGAAAILSGKWLFAQGFTPENAVITIETDLQENVLGKYSLTYTAEAFGMKATASRTVRVVDSVAPVILLNQTQRTILPGQPYIEEGYVAMDNYDGILTDKVRRVEELGVITYTVMDSSGNPTVAERVIPYYDPLAPELVLEGGENLVIPCGSV